MRAAGYLVAAAALAALALSAASAGAQEVPRVLRSLEGAWTGEGTLMGAPAAFEMAWRLHGELAVLTFRNARRAPDGELIPVLEAAAVYRVAGGPGEGVWLDSRPARLELTWTADAATLVTRWREEREEGRTTYRVLGGGRVEVVDEVLVEGGWRTFGRARYRPRGPGPPPGR